VKSNILLNQKPGF